MGVDTVAVHDANRIFTCVNALAGVPHPEKLPELLAALKAEAEAAKRCSDGPSQYEDGELEQIHHTLKNRLLDASIRRARAFRAMMGETI
jgi:hypothetical protein